MPGGLDTRDSQPVTHASTNRARRCLTSQIGRDGVCSAWCGPSPSRPPDPNNKSRKKKSSVSQQHAIAQRGALGISVENKGPKCATRVRVKTPTLVPQGGMKERAQQRRDGIDSERGQGPASARGIERGRGEGGRTAFENSGAFRVTVRKE